MLYGKNMFCYPLLMDLHINTKATYVNPFDFCFYDFVNILNVLQTLFLAFAFFIAFDVFGWASFFVVVSRTDQHCSFFLLVFLFPDALHGSKAFKRLETPFKNYAFCRCRFISYAIANHWRFPLTHTFCIYLLVGTRAARPHTETHKNTRTDTNTQHPPQHPSTDPPSPTHHTQRLLLVRSLWGRYKVTLWSL